MRNLLTKKTTYTFDYPEALAFADKQNGVFWTFDEIDLSMWKIVDTAEEAYQELRASALPVRLYY